MREIIKRIYQFKIRLMFYFGLGYSELATPVAVIRDIAIVLTFIKLVFNISFGWWIDGWICVVSFGIFIGIGLILKASGLSDYATKIGNNINPDFKLLRRIAERLDVK